jgi:tetratricopeptide (TPR) repeat protein
MWGDITDLKSLMWLLGRGQYNPLEQGHTLNDTIRLLKYYFVNILPEQYPLLLAFILIPGTVLLARKLPKYGYVLNTAFIISTVSVIFTATNGPGLEFIIKQFLTFTYIFAAIFIAYCVYWIIGLIKNERIRIISMFILSITIVFLLYSKAPNYSRYFLSYDYSSNLTETIPEGAVYFAEGDLNCFGALYKNFIEKKNINEITVILLDQDWYREQLKRNYKDKIVVTDKASNPVADIKNLMYANRDKRIYYSNAHEEKLLSFTLVPRGIANEIIINKHPLYYDPYLYFKLYSYRGIFSDNMKYDDFTIVFTFEHYGLNLQELGNQFYTKGDIDKALFFFKRSFLFFENENVAALIGDCYFRKGDYESGLNYLRQAFQINRKCISAHYYMALYYISMKDIVNARQNILEILEYDPGNIQAQELLNKLNGGT